jgi:thioredoxin 1
MAVADVTPENLTASTSGAGLVLVECWSPSCGACRAFGPVFERVGENHPEHRFLRLDVTAEEGLSESLGIEHAPTLMVYRDGVLLFRQAGNYDEAQLTDIVGQAASLDMNMVRADIAAAENESNEGRR